MPAARCLAGHLKGYLPWIRACAQDCSYLGPELGRCDPGERYPGLWEVPLWNLQEGDTVYGFSGTRRIVWLLPPHMRPCGEAWPRPLLPRRPPPRAPPAGYGDTRFEGTPAVANMSDLFIRQLDARLQGGRTPLQISTFYEWLSVEPPPGCATPDDPRCFNYVRLCCRRDCLAALLTHRASAWLRAQGLQPSLPTCSRALPPARRSATSRRGARPWLTWSTMPSPAGPRSGECTGAMDAGDGRMPTARASLPSFCSMTRRSRFQTEHGLPAQFRHVLGPRSLDARPGAAGPV